MIQVSMDSVASHEFLQLPSCLLSMEAASLVLFHPFADLVLGVVPQI